MEMKYYPLLTHFKRKSRFILSILLFKFFYFFCKESCHADNDKVLSQDITLLSHQLKKFSDDDFINPGILWVEQGMTLWNKKHSKSQFSCKILVMEALKK